jgi:AmiR/NasT family two-component response regulator
VRVVVFSGYSESEVLQRLGDQPVAGILPKPFTSQSLLEKVAAFLPARPAHA